MAAAVEVFATSWIEISEADIMGYSAARRGLCDLVD